MFKLIVKTLTVLLVSKTVLAQLCSVRKSSNTCVCKTVTDNLRNSIVSEADCSRTGLEEFPKFDQDTYNLNQLDLSHNRLTQLNENNVAPESNTLEKLLLSYNQITFISDGFFKNLPNLKKLDLSHNNLSNFDSNYILENSINLIHLDLSFNNIKKIGKGMFSPLTKLTYLDLSYNDYELGALLNQNAYTLNMNLGVSLDLETLKLENLGMTDLHNFYFVNYTNLKVLSLADNAFTEVPRVPSYLEYLDLSGSNITELKKLSFYSVKTLKFDRMRNLETIQDNAFYNLGSLEDLSMSNCRNLKKFQPSVFGDLHKNMNSTLKRLSLSGNALLHLNSTFRYLLQNMQYVDVTNNPWICDCDFLWLLEYDIELHKIENIRCSGPFRVATMKFIDITDKNLPDCYPEKYGKKTHRVLITILVVLVMSLAVLVFYLLYYNPDWYNRRRMLSPDSPYNPANQA